MTMHNAARSSALERLGHVYQWLPRAGDPEADLVRYHLQQAERILENRPPPSHHRATGGGDSGRRVEDLIQWATTMAEVMDSILSQAQQDASIDSQNTGAMEQATHWRLTLGKAQRLLRPRKSFDILTLKPGFSDIVTKLRTGLPLPSVLDEAATALEELVKSYEQVFCALWHIAKRYPLSTTFVRSRSFLGRGRATLEIREHPECSEVIVLEDNPP